MFLGSVFYGLTSAAGYLLVALGITLLFGSMRVFFFAHGALYMMAAMLLWYFATSLGFNLIAGVFVVLLVMCVASVFVSMVIYRRVSYSAESGFVAFLALSLILESLAIAIFGTLPKEAPSFIKGSLNVFDVTMSLERAIQIPVAAVLVALLFVFIYRTKVGKALRATVQNIETSYLVGINPARVNIIVFIVGFVLVSLAGMVVAPTVYLDPSMGEGPLMKAFIIILLGGLGSIPGAIVGSLIIGLLESVVSTYLGVSPAMLTIFVLILAILIVRPRGIFGTGQL